jgi:pantoate--beta-alanine ligase
VAQLTNSIPIVAGRASLRSAITGLRAAGGTIALVPTMGALHAGHLELVKAARRHASHVVVSVFVNPTQFAPHEDFDRYPRQLEQDSAMLASVGADLIYAPAATDMYPPGDSTWVTVSGITDHFEGAFRPHFFAGVASVVSRLLIHCQPDMALFGEKDFQQLQVITKMMRDLGLPVEIIGVPTVREADGLAMSSRNAYLSPGERAAAAALPQAMFAMRDALVGGARIDAAIDQARGALSAAGFWPIDYCGPADVTTLTPIETGTVQAHDFGSIRLLFAAWLGKTRLIDNCGLTG